MPHEGQISLNHPLCPNPCKGVVLQDSFLLPNGTPTKAFQLGALQRIPMPMTFQKSNLH